MGVTIRDRDGACWRCDQRVGLSPACGTCHAPQPLAADVDHFEILGVPRTLVVDAADLERRYHELARRVHPDRHQTTEVEAIELSVQATAALNRAFRTLKDPIARGRYWLDLHGRPLGVDNNRVPPALASLVFEVQEQLEELRAAPDSSGIRAAVDAARAEVSARFDAECEALETFYARAGSTDEDLEELKGRLTDIAYLRTLLDDVEHEVDG
jgi:molecular chaperone HscB